MKRSVLSRLNHLSIEYQLKMFDKAFIPILLYEIETWENEKLDTI